MTDKLITPLIRHVHFPTQLKKTKPMHFTIDLSICPKQPKYIHQKLQGPSGQVYDKLCSMGQILKQLGEKTITKEGPIRTLTEMKQSIPPFTRFMRGQFIQSDSATIIMNADPFTDNGRNQITAVLAQHNHTVEFSNV